jgi:hypothetical protein
VVRNFGAGDRGRTGDVQLGNFLSHLMFFSFRAKTYPVFYHVGNFFRPLVISTIFTPFTFVLGTFWAREQEHQLQITAVLNRGFCLVEQQISRR